MKELTASHEGEEGECEGSMEDARPLEECDAPEETDALEGSNSGGAATGDTTAAASGDSTPTLSTLDAMISRMQGLKRKLESLHAEEQVILEQSKKRISHLNDLYGIPTLVDEGYDRWSRVRLDRLLVDALLRNGYGESAKMLAKEKNIEVGGSCCTPS